MSSALVNLVRQATNQSNQSAAVLFLLGVTLTLWTGIAVLKALRITSALTWGIRPAPLARPLQAAVTTSIVLAVLVVLNTVANLVFGNFGLPVLVLADVVVLVTVATWSFLALPHPPDITIRDVVPGALLFALGSLVLAVFARVYLAGRIDRANDLYGALGLATVFLLWLFLLGRLIVGGFALNATIRQHRSITSESSPLD
jgi:membrane protein